MGSLRFFGDREKAISIVGEAKRQMYLLKEHMKFNNLQQLSRTINTPDGDIIFVQSIFGQELIQIDGTEGAITKKVEAVEKYFKFRLFREDSLDSDDYLPIVPDTIAEWESMFIDIWSPKRDEEGVIVLDSEGYPERKYITGGSAQINDEGELSTRGMSFEEGYWVMDSNNLPNEKDYWIEYEASNCLKTQYPYRYASDLWDYGDGDDPDYVRYTRREQDLVKPQTTVDVMPYYEYMGSVLESTLTTLTRVRTHKTSVPYRPAYFHNNRVGATYEWPGHDPYEFYWQEPSPPPGYHYDPVYITGSIDPDTGYTYPINNGDPFNISIVFVSQVVKSANLAGSENRITKTWLGPDPRLAQRITYEALDPPVLPSELTLEANQWIVYQSGKVYIVGTLEDYNMAFQTININQGGLSSNYIPVQLDKPGGQIMTEVT